MTISIGRTSTGRKNLGISVVAINLLVVQQKVGDAFLLSSSSSSPAKTFMATKKPGLHMTPPAGPGGWYGEEEEERRGHEQYYPQQSYEDYHHRNEGERAYYETHNRQDGVGGSIWEGAYGRQQQQERVNNNINNYHPMGRSQYHGPDPWGRTAGSYSTTSSGTEEQEALGGRIPGPGYLEAMPSEHKGASYNDYHHPQEEQQLPPQPATSSSSRIMMMDDDPTIETILPNKRRQEAPSSTSTFTPQEWAHENIHVVGGPKHDLLVDDYDDRTHYLSDDFPTESDTTTQLWDLEQFHASRLDFSRVGQDVPLDIFFYYDNPPSSTTPTIEFGTPISANTNTDTDTTHYDSSNSVATMMTQEHKRVLIEELGYRRKDVKRLKFDKVQEIIQYRIQCPPDGPNDEWCT